MHLAGSPATATVALDGNVAQRRNAGHVRFCRPIG